MKLKELLDSLDDACIFLRTRLARSKAFVANHPDLYGQEYGG